MTDTSAPQTIKEEVLRQRNQLEREDSKIRREALEAVSAQTNPLFAALRNECAGTGHEWKFHSLNWDNACSWDICKWCGAKEPTDAHRQSEAAK